MAKMVVTDNFIPFETHPFCLKLYGKDFDKKSIKSVKKQWKKQNNCSNNRN